MKWFVFFIKALTNANGNDRIIKNTPRCEMDSKYHIHSFNDTVVPATCKECGYTLHKCECGYEHKDNYTPLAEHCFELVEESDSTCTESGKKRYRCTVCGGEKEEVFSVGHSWSEWSIKQHPTCTEKGVRVRICSRCGQVEEGEIEATGHELTSPKKSLGGIHVVDLCAACGSSQRSAAGLGKQVQHPHRALGAGALFPDEIPVSSLLREYAGVLKVHGLNIKGQIILVMDLPALR